MDEPSPERTIVVGNRPVALPDGVSASEWALERNQYQNARIRILLGSINMLEQVLDSNYAILHCSPARLREIWSQVRAVSKVIRQRFAPLLRQTSPVPKLDDARRSVGVSLRLLIDSSLDELDRQPEEFGDDQLPEVRKILCVAMGKLHAFLQDAFGAVMGGDPRSLFDRDYFLSKRFRRDVEEGEWLYRRVGELNSFLQAVARQLGSTLEPALRQLGVDKTLPSESMWTDIEEFLDRLDDSTRKLHQVLALHGIRFEELELLQGYAGDLPDLANGMRVLQGAGRGAVERLKSERGEAGPAREQSVVDLMACHAVFSEQMASRGRQIRAIVHDLSAFIPIWLDNIGKRRSLLLYRRADGGGDGESLAAAAG